MYSGPGGLLSFLHPITLFIPLYNYMHALIPIVTALEVDCSISSTRDPNVLAVFCSSNREGNVTVDILSCDVDRELPLDEFCMLILVIIIDCVISILDGL